jgi:ATP-binding cassette, subfamily B, bacterial PglK
MGNRNPFHIHHPIFVLLSSQEWRQLVVLVVLTVLFTVVELAGIGGAGLFIQLATDPDGLESIPYASETFDWFGVAEGKERLLATLAALLSLILLRNAIAMAVLWWRLRFLQYTRRDLATRLIRSYLSRPYSFFLRNNSAMMSKTVLVEANELVTRYIFAWITLITDGLMLAATLSFLFYLEPVVTLISGAIVGGLGFLVVFGLRSRMRNLGQHHRSLNEKMFRVTNEAMASIKEVKVLGREESFASDFYKTASRFAQVSLRFMLYTDGPRYLLEIITVVGFFIFVMVAMQRTESLAEVAGLIGAFGFATYRILPVTHNLVSAVGGLNFNRAIVQGMVDAIVAAKEGPLETAATPLPMHESVELQNVCYRYEEADTEVLRDVSLRVTRNESIGIVGPSGAGKSTLVDVLIGLLSPTQGSIAVDGQPLQGDDVSAWQRNVGYVPQTIYLLDDTIRRNIAIGFANEEIDDERINNAIASAQLQELIHSLPDGLDTIIGERGIRISGGQRQRIGIARALYHKASVLILDEATSSLDNKTESAVRKSIERLKGRLTLIVIAHRLTTVRDCDRIVVLGAGRVVGEGNYETLLNENEHFQSLVYADVES